MSLLFSVSVSCDDFFLGSVQGILWRAIYLEGSPRGGLFFVCVCFLSPWLDQPSLRYQMVYAIFMEIIIPIPYSIFHTLCYM